ncbi:MAG: hypothetical protein DRQ88_12210 [Epsilonproteobacteria bacterium]|nr:MAG: hypothetical protein DRQ89_10590 [Campylobacterota bacterium]RLA63606.1 MAG: hypothetical protein DRQ88_12210 [Campylobacterota bacterium]
MKKILIILLFSYSSITHAGLLIEPYLGWDFGVGKTETTDVDFNSWDLGGRVGWIFKTLMVGVDADWKSMTPEFDSVEGATVDVTNFGVFIGAWLPLMLNFRVGYVFSSTWALENGDEDKGQGFSAGVGARLFFLALNVDYKYLTYDSELSSNDILLSVSVPFNLF